MTSPTPEQSAILDHTSARGHSNLMINALAGTGKSHTLKLIDKVHKTKPAIYLVFNKRNQLEAIEAQKAGAFASTTSIKTFNGLGHGVLAKMILGDLNLDKSKSRNLLRAAIDGMKKPETDRAWKNYTVIMDGLEKARSLGYVPDFIERPYEALISQQDLIYAMDEEPDEDAMRLIDQILATSIEKAFHGHIDFSDQIYIPAIFGGLYSQCFPQFPRAMVDEYQDQSPVNHILVDRLLGKRRNATLIGVGDPFQNIYGFRGAKASGMADAVAKYSMSELPLSISFRCPSAIVEAARWRVPHFQYSKVGGSVNVAAKFRANDLPIDATIICRNNAPLIRTAFKLLSIGRSVSVVGSELGPRLIAVMKKLGDTSISRAALLTEIEYWREQKLIAGSKSANDLADCMRVFAEHGDSLGSAISYAEHIFAQNGSIQLLTGHKSKGLEFNDVFWLDRHLLREDHEQDANLAYVITTRSANNLTELDSSAILW